MRLSFGFRLHVFLVLALLVRPVSALAGTVDVVRGQYLLFHEELPIRVRDRYMTFDAQGHATGFLMVRRSNGTRAVARVESGSPQVGEETRLIEEEQTPAPDRFHWPEQTWDIGLTAERATADLGGSSSTAGASSPFLPLTGTSIGAYLGTSVKAAHWLSVQGNVGYRSLSASYRADSPLCSGSNDCTLRLGLLNFYGGARFYPFDWGKFRPYFAAGLDFGFPIDRESTAVDPKSFHLTIFYRLGLGLQFYLAPEHALFIGASYAAMTSTAPTNVSVLGLQLEHAWEF